MQIQAITGDNGTQHLEAIRRKLEQQGVRSRIVQAEAYSAGTLRDALEVLVSGGSRVLLVDHCTYAQVHAVLEWQCEVEEGELEDLEIHLVRSA